MTLAEVNQLPLGLYRVHWKSGGSSLAAVGNTERGKRWLAPCNWLGPHIPDDLRVFDLRSPWLDVARAEILFSTSELRAWEDAGQ